MSESSMDVDLMYSESGTAAPGPGMSSDLGRGSQLFLSSHPVRQGLVPAIKPQPQSDTNVFADPIPRPPVYGSPRYRWPEIDEREINDTFPEGSTPYFSDQQLHDLAMMYGIPRIGSGLPNGNVQGEAILSNGNNTIDSTTPPSTPSVEARSNSILNLSDWQIPQPWPDEYPGIGDERRNPFIIAPQLGPDSSQALARRILEGRVQCDPFAGGTDAFVANANHCAMQLEAMIISDDENDEDGDWVPDDYTEAMDVTDSHTAPEAGLLPSIKRKRPQRSDTRDSASSERPTKRIAVQADVQRTGRHR